MFRLMIKTHRTTNFKYLCVTTKEDYEGYCGSGVRWRKHLKKHGFDVSTELLFEHESRDFVFKSVCLYFSELYDVVNSDDWANLILEDGNTGSAFTRYSDKAKVARSENFKELFCDPVKGDAWGRNISRATTEIWSRRSQSERDAIRDKKTAFYTEENRVEHSNILKEYHSNMSDEQRKEKGKILSDKYQSQSDDWKAARGNKISESLQESSAFVEYVDRMKEERVGGNNPAARIVHWDGLVFDSCKAFFDYIRENKIISKNAAEQILKKSPTADRYIASKKTGEKLYAN